MAYSGATSVGAARGELSEALVALQDTPDLPDDVMAVAQMIAKATGALFEAERASTDPDGKSGVKSALESLSQTLALLQDVKSSHDGIGRATQVIASVMGTLFDLSNQPAKGSQPPPKPAAAAKSTPAPAAKSETAPAAAEARPEKKSTPAPNQGRADLSSHAPPAPPASDLAPAHVEANIGATTQSNFFVGFSGEVSDGGVFLATYDILALNHPVKIFVTLPGSFSFTTEGWVRYVRDPFDLNSDSDPGMGIQFSALEPAARELILRFVRKRAPLFYDA